MATVTLNIDTTGSDGHPNKWPKHSMERNDEYLLDKVANTWIKDFPGGAQPGTTYRLDRLPAGYAGWEKRRPDSKHVDRYVYGHPNGAFRSINEFYPHFKHLMDMGGSAGCTCVKCLGAPKKEGSKAPKKSKYFAKASSSKVASGGASKSLAKASALKKGPYLSSDEEYIRPDVDAEGTVDVYERLIQRLKAAGAEGRIDDFIEEKTSPDWHAVNERSKEALQAMRALPSFAPRMGELVLFVRKLNEGEGLAWDKGTNSFRRLDLETNTWRAPPRWEIGVVTQTPEEEIIEEDLVTNAHKEQSIVYSGFKVEPLPEPGNNAKPLSRQHKLVPLHAIRPFAMWQDCLRSTPEKDWHSTVKHALTVASSFCCVGRYRFVGTWPTASISCRALYLGPELILSGDTVRLLPRSAKSGVTEAMKITAITLRFVNLDFDDDDLAPTPPDLPYQTSLHIFGKVFTTDPSHSFNGVSKTPIDPKTELLPTGLQGYGPWFHYTDPDDPSARVEVPFSRILGRCREHSAMTTFYTTPPNVKTDMAPPPSTGFKPVNAIPTIALPNTTTIPNTTEHTLLSRGTYSTKTSRSSSRRLDTRLLKTEQRWFWADTRIEQLDLHEVNDRYVGVKDAMRTKEQMKQWGKALKGLAGKRGELEAFERGKKRREEVEKAVLGALGGMGGSGAADEERGDGEVDSGEEEEHVQGVEDLDTSEDADAMEIDEPPAAAGSGSWGRQSTGGSAPPPPLPSVRAGPEVINLMDMDSEDEDEMAKDQLVGELFKNVRPGGGRG